MKECEMCGRESELVKAKIEDTVLMVCRKCSALGAQMDIAQQSIPKKTTASIEVQELVPDFAEKIKAARESLGFSKNDLAGRIGISASVMSRIEKGMRPVAAVTKKLEKELGIDLFYTDTVRTIKTKEMHEVTLGDIVQLRIRKK